MHRSSASPALGLHFQTAGKGPAVVCLHSSGASSLQWRSLIEAGQRDYRFIAVDFHGHGSSAEYGGARYSLQEEADAVLRSLPDGWPMHLVGHSYGGAVALDLAVRHPFRFASVTVFEPVLFGVLEPASSEYREISSIGLAIASDARGGRIDEACARFVDYWNGHGAWKRLPAARQQRVRERIVPVARHFEALFANPLPFERLRALRQPTLVLCGGRSPAPARAVCARLATLSTVRVGTLPAVGHMGPVTHPDLVNGRVLAHLTAVTRIAMAA